MAKRVRIKDIAERSGVSKGTVDRVIHSRGHVAPEVKKRILQVMEELNYRPNRLARALSYNKSWKIAALLPMADVDPFWNQPLQGIDLALNATLDSLNETLGQVNKVAETVGAGSREVSDSAQALSQGATEQASSLQQ
ncbi:MAG: LacI family DNA-binding transcriptional regulator, partial [Bacteroidota bacterium]